MEADIIMSWRLQWQHSRDRLDDTLIRITSSFFCEKEPLSFHWGVIFLKLFSHIFPLYENLLSKQVKIKQIWSNTSLKIPKADLYPTVSLKSLLNYPVFLSLKTTWLLLNNMSGERGHTELTFCSQNRQEYRWAYCFGIWEISSPFILILSLVSLLWLPTTLPISANHGMDTCPQERRLRTITQSFSKAHEAAVKQ